MSQNAEFAPRCHGCNCAINTEFRERAHSHGHLIVFHNKGCFLQYINRNRPAMPTDISLPLAIVRRLEIRLSELEQESQFSNPSSHQSLVNDSVRFELLQIRDGRADILKSAITVKS